MALSTATTQFIRFKNQNLASAIQLADTKANARNGRIAPTGESRLARIHAELRGMFFSLTEEEMMSYGARAGEDRPARYAVESMS